MTMQTRFKTVKVEVEVSGTKLRGYEIAKGDEGWMFYDPITDLTQQQQMTSTYMSESAFLEFGNKDERTVITIDRERLKGAILHPFLRLAPKIIEGVVSAPPVSWAAENYVFNPDLSQWDFTRSESGLFIECTQKYHYPPGTTEEEIASGAVGPVRAAMGYLGSSTEEGYVGMCPNGFFAAGVRRSALSEEAQQYLEQNLSYSEASYTDIYFGANILQQRWLLRVPLVGAPVLYENTHYAGSAPEGWTYFYPNWVVRPWTEGSLSAVNPSKAAKEGLTYRIGAIGRAICVTESTFEDDFAYYLVGQDQAVDAQELQPVIPAGPVRIINWPGQCTMWLDLMMFPEQGFLYRYPFAVPGYDEDKVLSYAHYQPLSLPHVAGNEAGPLSVIEIPADPEQVPPRPTQVHYSAPLTRGQYPDQDMIEGEELSSELLTYTTPFLQAVTISREAELTENVVLWTQPQNVPLELTSDLAMGKSEAQHHQLQLDNRQITNPRPEGEPEPEGGYVPAGVLSPGREVRIKAGWIYERAIIPAVPEPDPEDPESEPEWSIPVWEEVPVLVPQGVFTVIEPGLDAREANFDLTDPLGLLNLKRWEWGTISGRGWYVYDFVTWLLKDAGIGPKRYDIEDLETLIPDDTEQAVWKVGTSYAQIISECVERFGSGVAGSQHVGAALWYDGQSNKIRTGCRYCRTKRTALNWAAHQDNGWASSGCLAADAARVAGGVDFVMVDTPALAADYASLFIAKTVKVKVTPLQAEKYANRIVVIGKAHGDYPIYSRWTNEAALYHSEGTPGEEYVGFGVTHIEEDDSLTTQALCDARRNQLVQWLSSWPRQVSITAPLMANARPGQVLRVTAGQYAGIAGKTFRITGVNHGFRSHETGLEAREITGTGGGQSE